MLLSGVLNVSAFQLPGDYSSGFFLNSSFHGYFSLTGLRFLLLTWLLVRWYCWQPLQKYIRMLLFLSRVKPFNASIAW